MTNNQQPPKSPFFKPSATPRIQIQTPGGTRRTTKQSVEEHKSTRLGCTANLINAIIGSGIVGIPYAILQAGFVAGIFLIVLCAILTDKSLRLLIATAKHAKVPSYETVAEAAFGKWGFGFISINMFIMAYGAMLSYLMIVKDTFSVAFGVDPAALPVKRAILFVISVLIIVPLSSQRDMADLAKTSRISVIIDCLLVLVVAYKSPVSVDRISSLTNDTEWLQTNFWIHTDTIFVGLGVLSFAFVCQHSAFIIAGSLERPTIARWSNVTQAALTVCATLALVCGISGYLGFLGDTKGNIINNLQVTDIMSNIARCMLGCTMLFVYPLESFVARHVCVVMLFEGRRAHEGEDASILARRDRRIGLTVALYISALVPAILFEDLGQVLAATGAVGGSCLSYIGPGAIYMGIHGDDFLAMIRNNSWWCRFVAADDETSTTATSTSQDQQQQQQSTESTLLIPAGEVAGDAKKDTTETNTDNSNVEGDINICIKVLQAITWYSLGMPVWCWIAKFGKVTLTQHRAEQALKSPHPLRIGDVAPDTPQTTPKVPTPQQRHSIDNNAKAFTLLHETRGASSFHERGAGLLQQQPYQQQQSPGFAPKKSLNDQIGARLLANKQRQQRQEEQQQQALEKDPQKEPPTVVDFLIAIFFVLFGIMALFAGLVSLAIEEGGGGR